MLGVESVTRSDIEARPEVPKATRGCPGMPSLPMRHKVWRVSMLLSQLMNNFCGVDGNPGRYCTLFYQGGHWSAYPCTDISSALADDTN